MLRMPSDSTPGTSQDLRQISQSLEYSVGFLKERENLPGQH